MNANRELEKWQNETLDEVLMHFDSQLISEPRAKYSTSKKYQDNLLLKLTFEFALDSIKYSKKVKA